MLVMFIIIDIYSLHYDIMKRHICQCVCPDTVPHFPCTKRSIYATLAT